MEKKCLYCFVVGIITFFSISVFADNNDDDPIANPVPHLAPSRQLASVAVDELNKCLIIHFRQNIKEAYLYIYKDDSLINMDWLVDSSAGSVYSYSTEGYGKYEVVLQTENGTLTVFEGTIEENS